MRDRVIQRVLILGSLLFVCGLRAANVTPPSFPGAKGFGANTPARGVATLFSSIIFRVSGLITLDSPLNITEPFLTVAGQTTPIHRVLLEILVPMASLMIGNRRMD